jgi:hypothetical protein
MLFKSEQFSDSNFFEFGIMENLNIFQNKTERETKTKIYFLFNRAALSTFHKEIPMAGRIRSRTQDANGAVQSDPVIGPMHLLLNWRFKVCPAPSLVGYWITKGSASQSPVVCSCSKTASTWTRHKAGMMKKPSPAVKGTPTSS